MASKPSHDPSRSQEQPQSASKRKHLEPPTPGGTPRPGTRHNPPTTPGQLLPATALFQGPHDRNASNVSVNRHSRDDRSTGTPVDRDRDRDRTEHQHLPRAHPPTSSFSGVARPSLIGEHALPRASHKTPPNNLGGQQPAAATSSKLKKDEDFRADAVWAEMQKTLADVELSAMNSSHVFSAQHVSALEDLRSAQLGLARAWAKSEAEEGGDEEFGRDEQGVGSGTVGAFAGNRASPNANVRGGHTGSKQGSTASNNGRDWNLEEETERDIKLARQRREANDRYFKQVNSGVVDIVKRLDEVVGAMRRVEKESREIWNSSDSGNGSGSGSGNDSEDLGVQTETDESVKRRGYGGRKKGGTNTKNSVVGMTDSEVLTDSPVETRGRGAQPDGSGSGNESAW